MERRRALVLAGSITLTALTGSVVAGAAGGAFGFGTGGGATPAAAVMAAPVDSPIVRVSAPGATASEPTATTPSGGGRAGEHGGPAIPVSATSPTASTSANAGPDSDVADGPDSDTPSVSTPTSTTTPVVTTTRPTTDWHDGAPGGHAAHDEQPEPPEVEHGD